MTDVVPSNRPNPDHAPSEMQGLWDWLHEATCGCRDALDNGTALVIMPQAPFADVQHQSCGTREPTRLPWAPCLAWLARRSCPACQHPLSNGLALLIAPQALVRHLSCRRPDKQWEQTIRAKS